MFRKWKALDKLDCVKMYGHNHKIEHIMGIQSHSKCTAAIGAVAVAEGLKKGLEMKVDPERLELKI